MVVWAQEHLVGAGEDVPVTGIYGKETRAAVREFQEGHGLEVDGRIGTTTWQALLAFTPYRVPWAGGTAGTSAVSGRARPVHRPLSASLPARGYEIPANEGTRTPTP